MVGLSDFEQGVGQTALFGPPHLQVAAKRAGADLPQSVGFEKMFNRNDCLAHLYCIHECGFHPVEHDRAERDNHQHEHETVQQIQRIDRSSSQEGVAEGLHDGCHGVGFNQHLKAHRDRGNGVNDRGGVHQQGHAKGHQEAQVAVLGGEGGDQHAKPQS